MKFNIFKSGFLLTALAGTLAVSSCKKVLDIEPESALTAAQTYNNVYDADAAVLGIYGKFLQLAKPYVLLNELRADLMAPTANADTYLQQLSNHNATEDNPYINPAPFYEVILNCNDVLTHFDKMLAEKKLKENEYSQRYSDVAAIRTWTYLQLGIHFSKDAKGTVGIPYVTNPLTTISDVKNGANLQYLPFQQLLSQLIKTMESLPTLADYSTSGTTLITTVDQYPTNKFFINKRVLLGDLHLWNAAYDPSSYRKSATYYKQVITTYDNDGNDNTKKNYYKIIGAPDPATGNQLAVQYVRYRESDINNLYESNTEGWRSMFSRGKVSYDAQYNWEWVWVLPFSSNFAPKNPFIELMSPIGGSYLVKPSRAALDAWNSQTQKNFFPYDARGSFTVKYIGGQPVIMKYLYYALDGSSFLPTLNSNGRNGEWWLYRAASVWQHFGEAATRDGYPKLGYSVVNQGIRSAYTPSPAPSNVTDIQNTLNLPEPYQFDARSGDNPNFRAIYRDMAGLRGRAYLNSRPLVTADSTREIESQLVDEAALELAYEGQRWSDLLRVAIRRNEPSFIAERVYNKLIKENGGAAGTAKDKLLAGEYYLPLKWQ
ncbi:RagB/SusD family nutrient uptake outer membrane protein [Paraflavisolibacter sp. H34]|uniref:RagB/SusD family nutrient uptake outer membrane protein n=1 Tax=Huijunlia imazamoxiresistens TaxID=3127457 RepID=UPI003018363E